MKRFATIMFLCFCAVGLNLVPSTMAQTLSGEARSHWNKALIYIENAKVEDEWQMAVNELEQVISLTPDYTEVYLKLGDSYSQLSSSEAIEKAKYYWREYEKRTPSAATEIQDKIDRLEALSEISLLRNREAIIESLVGRWRIDKDFSIEFGEQGSDIEIFRENNRLMLRYVYFSWWYNGGRGGEPGGMTTYQEIPLNGDSVVIEYKNRGEWRDVKNGQIVDKSEYKYNYKYVVSQPQVDGVIKGTRRVDYLTTPQDIYLYKVN